MEEYGRTISLSQTPNPSNPSSEEENDHTTPPPPITTPPPHFPGEVTNRKPRGRPPGSKNKPKPALVITREPEPALKPIILEISPGNDVVETLSQFARRRQLGLTILNGSGSVSNVTIRHPGSHATSLTLHGPFSLLSLTGTFLGYGSSQLSNMSIGISLSGVQGQIFGGVVAGKVLAATKILIVGSTFVDPEFYRLPEETVAPPSNGGGEGSGNYGSVVAPTPLNACHVAGENVVGWAGPTSRTPPPY